VPVTRAPDAHWMAEARYRGQKVVVCSPDYSDAAKFADEWLAPAPGTDGALAMAMGHVILREFLVDRQAAERIGREFARNAEMTVAGLAILVYRRRVTGPVFSATTRNDKAMYVLLAALL